MCVWCVYTRWFVILQGRKSNNQNRRADGIKQAYKIMCNKLRTLSLIILMFGFMPSILAQGFWQRLGQAVVSVATGAAENYVGSTLNDDDRKAWNEISNDINHGLGLDNNYVNAGNKLQEGKTTDAVVNMGVTAASNSGNQTLITVSKTVQAQNDYVNNVSSGMDQKTAQDAAARQISDALLDDMEERERIAAEKRRQERIAAERRNEYNSSSNTYTTSNSTSSNSQYSTPIREENSASSKTQYNTQSKTGSKEQVTNSTSNSILKYKREDLDALSQRIEEVKQLLGKVSNKNQKEYSELQETLRDMAIEYWEKNEEYKQLSLTGNTVSNNQNKLSISQNKYSNEQAELLALLGDMSIEYWEKNEEYKRLVSNGSSSSILKYKNESVNALSESIMEVRKLLK